MKRPTTHAFVFLPILGMLAQQVVATDRTETPSDTRRARVIISTDFPPIGVVKEGNVPNTQKSDPDDMQSMVRFLLNAYEFEVEGLIASAGTFAMEAHNGCVDI